MTSTDRSRTSATPSATSTAPSQGDGRGTRDGGSGRFAPSPTGELHLGNLRTALLAWLFARSAGMRFLVRIDDLDPDRTVAGMEQRQLDDLAALGIDWDEAPVRQSERLHLYRSALDELRAADAVYRCFCTRAEIREAASAPHGPLAGGAYPGTCSVLGASEVQRRLDAGEASCLRVRAGGAVLAYDDRLLGRVEAAVDDFVVMRKDGVPAYNLAAVVDDAAQGIVEVVRGADLADTTPRQLWLAGALGMPSPAYAHVGLMLGSDGSRLAKRHGSVTLAALGEAGYDAGAVRSLLAASVGLAAPGEPVSIPQLLERFDPGALPAGPTTYDASVPVRVPE